LHHLCYFYNLCYSYSMLRFLPVVIFVLLVLSLFAYSLHTSPFHLAKTAQAPTTPQSDYNLADVLNATGDFDPSPSDAFFDNQPVTYPKQELVDAATQDQQTAVLGATTNAAGEEKWVEVDLAKQQATAWEGNKIVRQFLVSTGRWAPTPPGTF